MCVCACVRPMHYSDALRRPHLFISLDEAHTPLIDNYYYAAKNTHTHALAQRAPAPMSTSSNECTWDIVCEKHCLPSSSHTVYTQANLYKLPEAQSQGSLMAHNGLIAASMWRIHKRVCVFAQNTQNTWSCTGFVWALACLNDYT